jgi:C4-dicarboxylate-specific signal transduction histidine kinase
MGLAISGMHYTGMRAAIFTAHGTFQEAQADAGLDRNNLALAVAGITFVVLACALIASASEQKRAEEALRQARAELARIHRVILLGEMAASIAHEVNQPIAAVVTSAGAGLRWLAAQPPHPEEAREALDRIVRDGNRASQVISRIHALVRKAPPRRVHVDINETILEVIALTRSELQRNRVTLQTRLSSGLPLILGDRIQLQQVLLNLIMNALEAMSDLRNGPRALLVGSEQDGSNSVFVAVRDGGPGLDPEGLDHLFEAFYTTKPDGIGMGLAISRSIIEAHGGRLWATPNVPQGAVFQFRLPIDGEEASLPVTRPSS